VAVAAEPLTKAPVALEPEPAFAPVPLATRRLVVVGAGTMGAWTALLARRAGWDVTLLDAWGVGHPRATSGDETRVTRASHGPDELYTRWSRRALELWKALGEEVGERLFVEAGCLWFARRPDGFEAQSEPTLRRLGVPAERLDPDEVTRRWPGISGEGLSFALFEPQAGALMARRGVQAAVRALVESDGRFELAEVRPGSSEGGRLETVEAADDRIYSADAFVFACGPWLAGLFPELMTGLLSVTKQDVIFVGPAPGDTRYRAENHPVWCEFDAPAYGIPAIDQRGFKLAHDVYGPPFDPTAGERLADPASIEAVRRQLRLRFPGLAEAPVVETRVCQYETTPDTHFIIDRHPEWENVWLAGGGSGHGFKHGPSIGRYLVGLLEGRSPEELEGADAGRFRIGPRPSGPGVRSAGHRFSPTR
jgi:glycine/D-amino acid oxidase-like deaminating enzyme